MDYEHIGVIFIIINFILDLKGLLDIFLIFKLTYKFRNMLLNFFRRFNSILIQIIVIILPIFICILFILFCYVFILFIKWRKRILFLRGRHNFDELLLFSFIISILLTKWIRFIIILNLTKFIILLGLIKTIKVIIIVIVDLFWRVQTFSIHAYSSLNNWFSLIFVNNLRIKIFKILLFLIFFKNKWCVVIR